VSTVVNFARTDLRETGEAISARLGKETGGYTPSSTSVQSRTARASVRWVERGSERPCVGGQGRWDGIRPIIGIWVSCKRKARKGEVKPSARRRPKRMWRRRTGRTYVLQRPVTMLRDPSLDLRRKVERHCAVGDCLVPVGGRIE
jgi:hypothetical protein